MKIETRDISSFLAKGLGNLRACLVYGPDEGKVREYGKSLVQQRLGAGFDPMSLIELTGAQLDDDPARLQDELCSISLLGGERVVMLRQPERGTTGIIKEAIANPAASTLLIILGDDLAKDSALRKWAEAAPDVAAVPAYADEGAQLDQLIRQTFAQAGVRTTPEAIQYLQQHLGNHRGITRAELDKIITFLGNEKELPLATAMGLVGENNELSMQDVCMAVASGEIRRLPPLLRRLYSEGEAPVAIVRSMLRYLQKLYGMHAHMQAGLSEDLCMKQARIFFKHLPLTKRHLARWSLPALAAGMEKLHACEKDLKGGSPLPPELVCARGLLSVATTPARSEGNKAA